MLQLQRMDGKSISSSDRGDCWLGLSRFCLSFCLSEAIGLSGAWVLPEERSAWVVQTPRRPPGPPPPSPQSVSPSIMTSHLSRARFWRDLLNPQGRLWRDRLNPYPILNISRTRTEPGRRPMPASTSRRKPECRPVSGSARSMHRGQNLPEWAVRNPPSQ